MKPKCELSARASVAGIRRHGHNNLGGKGLSSSYSLSFTSKEIRAGATADGVKECRSLVFCSRLAQPAFSHLEPPAWE